MYDGQPGVETTAHAPQPLIQGMNTFLEQLNITFRRDPTNYRPRCDVAFHVIDVGVTVVCAESTSWILSRIVSKRRMEITFSWRSSSRGR